MVVNDSIMVIAEGIKNEEPSKRIETLFNNLIDVNVI